MTTREKIIKVTVDQLSRKPLEKIVIREIAKEAGVNVAAVNYHFQSKETLVTEAINSLVSDNLTTWVDKNLNIVNPTKNDLAKFLFELHRNTIVYRDFSRTKMHHIISSDKPDESNRKIFELLFQIVKKIDPIASGHKLKTAMMFHSLISYSISSETAATYSGYTTTDKGVKSYINSMLKVLFPNL